MRYDRPGKLPRNAIDLSIIAFGEGAPRTEKSHDGRRTGVVVTAFYDNSANHLVAKSLVRSQTMTAAELNLHVNLDGLPSRMQGVLKAATNLVAIGLNSTTSITPESFVIPDLPMHHRYDSNNQWTLDAAKSIWEYWILRNGFRDIAEATSGLLEEIQRVLSYWQLSFLQSERGELLGDDWNELVVKKGRQFHKRTLPQKIEFFEKQYQFSVDLDLLRQVLSINAARNCFVHRGGVVAAEDAGFSGVLDLEWSALVALAIVDGKEQEVHPPQIFEGGTKIGVATRPRSKRVPIVESLEVNATEFAQMGWTLYIFSQSCAHRLESYGRERGIEFNLTAI